MTKLNGIHHIYLTVSDIEAAVPWFAEIRTGLDHVCFTVSDRSELDAWAARFTELGVAQSPIADAESYSVLVFQDPDGVRLELIAFA